MSVRLFTAVYPSDPAREHLAAALRSLSAAGHAAGQLRWSEPHSWHITCQFYGEMPSGSIDTVQQHLAESLRDMPAFRLSLRGAGEFHGRYLWIGVGESRREMTECMRRCVLPGIEPDHATPHPHLTVARTRRGRAQAHRGGPEKTCVSSLTAELAQDCALYAGPSFLVDRVHVLVSELGAGPGGGALHRRVGSIPLAQ
ncbi:MULTISPECIES: RNA 2',3'-cyclic phosphodiesterase [Corynebacterium]|uniref:RNA 2',3'-cyclic phosphodiesterase n=1 Tax=Corynebacterium TaxID=1716 RepID=UPI00124EC820|nr:MULTISPECIES: RNA 2',3'-cyclic phosphodiesterase [Corynebacterium]